MACDLGDVQLEEPAAQRVPMVHDIECAEARTGNGGKTAAPRFASLVRRAFR